MRKQLLKKRIKACEVLKFELHSRDNTFFFNQAAINIVVVLLIEKFNLKYFFDRSEATKRKLLKDLSSKHPELLFFFHKNFTDADLNVIISYPTIRFNANYK